MLASRFSRFVRAPQRTWQFNEGALGRFATLASRGLGMLRGNYVWQRALVSCGRALGLLQDHNFVILGATRSGTTLLVDYVNCHPGARCRGEILNPDYGYYGNPSGKDRERLRLHLESFFVKPPGTLLGAKLLTYQLDELPLKISDVVEVLHRPAVIVLYRENVLEQFASIKFAEHTGVWHSDERKAGAALSLDVEEFIAFSERERRMWRENLAGLTNLDVHFLSYEELTRSTQEAMRGVFGFLGLDECDVESRLVKLQPEPLAKRVVNFHEFTRPEILPHVGLCLRSLDASGRLPGTGAATAAMPSFATDCNSRH